MNEAATEYTSDEIRVPEMPESLTAASDTEIIWKMREAILAGTHWYLALLEAMGCWSTAEEEYEGRRYRYLIDGEAFDWLLLAERLCFVMDGLVPEGERDVLLFYGIPPLEMEAAAVRKLIGEIKFRQYLNFFYGVTVEEGLLLAVQEEVEKEKWAHGMRNPDAVEESFRRVYEADQETLLSSFRCEKRYPLLKSTSLGESKEFLYWLFKYRFQKSEKARIASDTRKSLAFLRSQWQQRGVFNVLFMDNGLAELRS